VRRFTANDTPETNDRINAFVPGKLFRHMRNFKCARAMNNGYLLFHNAMPQKAIHGAAEKLLRYNIIETADNDTE
jgi:hypothetical protein